MRPIQVSTSVYYLLCRALAVERLLAEILRIYVRFWEMARSKIDVCRVRLAMFLRFFRYTVESTDYAGCYPFFGWFRHPFSPQAAGSTAVFSSQDLGTGFFENLASPHRPAARVGDADESFAC